MSKEHIDVIVPVQVKMAGRYKMKMTDAYTGRVRETEWFDNLVTNNGLDHFGNGWSPYGYCVVGTGTTTPAVTQSTLTTLLASTSTLLSQTATAPVASAYLGIVTTVYQFPIGTATGNLSEIGVGHTTTSLFSRALITDGSGTPTTITVLSSEALDVTYEFQYVVPQTDVTGSVTINTIAYAWTCRAAQALTNSWCPTNSFGKMGFFDVNVYNGSINASITGLPSGTSASAGTVAIGSYTNGNYYVDSTVNSGLADANLSGGVSAMSWYLGVGIGNSGAMQIGFSPALPKTSSYTMSLTFRISWTQ
jgi:hypothetical protein